MALVITFLRQRLLVVSVQPISRYGSGLATCRDGRSLNEWLIKATREEVTCDGNTLSAAIPMDCEGVGRGHVQRFAILSRVVAPAILCRDVVLRFFAPCLSG